VQHNIFVQAGSEMGYPGLLLFVALIFVTWTTNARTRRIIERAQLEGRFIPLMADALDAALVGYLVSGFFVTVLFYPYFWFNLAMTSALHRVAYRAARRSSLRKTDSVAPATGPLGVTTPLDRGLRPAAFRALPPMDAA